MKAKRIQRKRTKGWRMPPGTVYVGRGSKWGNPYVVSKTETGKYRMFRYRVRPFAFKIDAIKRSVRCYKDRIAKYFTPSRLKELEGKDLACWCPLDKPCHADVLLEIANRGVM